MYLSKLEALIERYFCNPERQITLEAGSVVIVQQGYNDRLFFVLQGDLEGYFSEHEEKQVRVFSASQGAFIGVHSFFSGTWTASSTVMAKSEVTLAWIDRNTPAVEVEEFGPLTTQFMPVIVNELSRRQRRATQEAVAKEKVLQRLHNAEQMTTLGQLAAGLAHELNNAIGVVSSKAERLETIILELLEELHPEANQFFDIGLLAGQNVPTSTARQNAKLLEQKYGLEKKQAKALAKAIPDGLVSPHWLNNPDQAIRYWGMGCDLHDLRLAAKHTVGIVKSVKQLGRADSDRISKVNIGDTINQAIALLQSELRRVEVRLRPSPVESIWASETELVQVWVNIIKNACDAMQTTLSPQLEIRIHQEGKRFWSRSPTMDLPWMRQQDAKFFSLTSPPKKAGCHLDWV